MVQANIGTTILDLGKEILYFPLWWYTGGVKKYWLWAWSRIKRSEDILAFWIMLKNLHRPLYGDYSLIGILIGPLIRIFWFIFIALAMLLVLVSFFVLFCVYLLLPPLCIYLIWR